MSSKKIKHEIATQIVEQKRMGSERLFLCVFEVPCAPFLLITLCVVVLFMLCVVCVVCITVVVFVLVDIGM